MITVVGSANMDLVVQTPKLPAPGETVLGHGAVESPGGKGANQAVAAARAGSEVSFVGRVGRDANGAELARSLENAGVSLRHLTVDEAAPTGLAMIEVEDSGENTIVVIPGANGEMTPEDVEAAADTIGQSSVLVLQLEIPLAAVARAIELARSVGVSVVLNPAPALALNPAILHSVDVLVANEEEVGALSGLGAPLDPRSSGRLLVDAGAQAVVVTMGAEGAVVMTHDGQWDVPAFPVNPVDTTGAGDAFVGNLAHALDAGQSLIAAARFASAAAAASVQRLGAQPSMPTRMESEAILGDRGA